MEKTTTFKPQLISEDKKRFEAIIDDMTAKLPPLNNMIKDIEAFLKRTLTNDEKISAAAKPKEFIIEDLRKGFQFPNATDEFNLQAIGIDTKPIFDKIGNGHQVYFKTELKNGEFVISLAELDEVRESTRKYTTHEGQNQAFKIAKKLAALLNEADGLGLLNKYNKNSIARVTPLLEVPLGSEKIEVRAYGITDLREGGGY